MYEIATFDADGNITSRGGIKVHKKQTVLKWIEKNNQNCPVMDGGYYGVVEADENAITWREYLEECRNA